MSDIKELIKPLEDKLKNLESEAQTLRFGVSIPDIYATPLELVLFFMRSGRV